jgi:hypothetical protein
VLQKSFGASQFSGSVVFEQDRLPEKTRRFSFRVTHPNANVTQEIGSVREIVLRGEKQIEALRFPIFPD